MSSHNGNADGTFYKTPPADDRSLRTAELLALRLAEESGLSISDADDTGCDPYNSAGQYLVAEQQRRKP